MRLRGMFCRAFCAFFLVVSTGALAEPALTNGELLESSGIAHEIRGLVTTMQTGIDEAFQNGSDIDAKFLNAMRESLPVAYKPDDILRALDKGLDELLTPEEKAELLAHYRSPFGRRIADLEKATIRDSGKIRDFAARAPADIERAALYKRLDEAAGITSTGVTIATTMSIALQAGITSAAEGPEKVDIEALKAAEEGRRANLAAATQKEVWATLGYTYRDLSTDELATYVAVLETPTGRKFSHGLGRLLVNALSERAKHLGELIFKNMQTRKTT